MVKRILLIAMILAFVCTSAVAAGKLTVNQETLLPLDYYGTIEVDVFAEVENTGDKPVEYSAGLVELLDSEENTIDSTDSVYCYPSVLAPGERGYVYGSLYPGGGIAADDVTDFILTVTGKNASEPMTRMTATGTYDADVQEGYWTYNYVTAEVTNNTADTIFNTYCVYALKDAEGKLLYVNYIIAYMIGIPAGERVFLRANLSDSLTTYFKEKGLVPTQVDVIAYESEY